MGPVFDSMLYPTPTPVQERLKKELRVKEIALRNKAAKGNVTEEFSTFFQKVPVPGCVSIVHISPHT